MMKNIARFALILGIAAAPVIASAATPTTTTTTVTTSSAPAATAPKPIWKGKATPEQRAEWKAKRAAMVARFDTNKDGKLDDGERVAMKQALVEERFDKLDTNKDGVVSRAEFVAGAKQMQHRFARHHHHGRKGRGGKGHGGKKSMPVNPTVTK